ncbi:MAG TPA: cupin domain-containing protein [Dermatophilaceae bacterium]|nr:cupin domain-containing protein [Dermatophilaceae bacterium]
MMATHAEITDLAALGAELLDQAKASPHRRVSRLVVTGPRQRAVLMALGEGGELGEHDSPAAATFHVLRGRARLRSGDTEWVVEAGCLVEIPPERHSVTALTDCLVLLTVWLGA